jgi:hypothetical protein
MDTVPLPAFNAPGRLMSDVVIEIGLLVDDTVSPAATVTVPVPFADRVTPVAPEELLLNVILPLLALVESDKVPVAVTPPLTVIA